MDAVTFAVIVLWLVVIGLIIVLFAMARQIGVLYERVSPMGALVNESGPRIGDMTPLFSLTSLNGGEVAIGPNPSARR
jgi:methylamine dehydrogenase accessory protein MauD